MHWSISGVNATLSQVLNIRKHMCEGLDLQACVTLTYDFNKMHAAATAASDATHTLGLILQMFANNVSKVFV